jgi:hypothetical protein
MDLGLGMMFTTGTTGSFSCQLPVGYADSSQRHLFFMTTRHHRRKTAKDAVVSTLVVFALLNTFDFFAHLWGTADAFAYSPNFITKLIEEQTQIRPVGLLGVETVSSTGAREKVAFRPGNNGTTNAMAMMEANSTTATLSSTITSPLMQKYQVRTRFPPEPNGYLHLGHAKAICFNFAVARAFRGVCHMRLDDTNPSKEDTEYVNSILQDVVWIMKDSNDKQGETGPPWYGPVRKASDYFDTIYDCAMALIQSGDAYVDSLTAEEMRAYRGTLTESGIDSPFRTRTVAENVQMFQDMRDRKYPDGSHVLRAKIDMSSPNINMRDPTLYRIKHERHQETGGT